MSEIICVRQVNIDCYALLYEKAASIFVVDSVVLASGKYLMSTCYGRTKNLRRCTHIFVPGLSLL